MGRIQTREHEEEHCYVNISREELRETYAELKRLARIDRNFDDERSASNLEGLANRFAEVIDLAHPRRIHFQLCPMKVAWPATINSVHTHHHEVRHPWSDRHA